MSEKPPIIEDQQPLPEYQRPQRSVFRKTIDYLKDDIPFNAGDFDRIDLNYFKELDKQNAEYRNSAEFKAFDKDLQVVVRRLFEKKTESRK